MLVRYLGALDAKRDEFRILPVVDVGEADAVAPALAGDKRRLSLGLLNRRVDQRLARIVNVNVDLERCAQLRLPRNLAGGAVARLGGDEEALFGARIQLNHDAERTANVKQRDQSEKRPGGRKIDHL